MKRIISIILILALLCGCALAESGMTREDAYEKGIDALLDESADGYKAACAFFEEAGGYGNAKYFLSYAEALMMLAGEGADADDLNDAEVRIEYLSRNGKFTSELAEYRDLPSCEELLQYISARRRELNGDRSGALAIYGQLFILDTFDRYITIKSEISSHEHVWSAATCDTPRVCATCGIEDTGSELGHDWEEATCYSPKTCIRCGLTEGKALGHNYTAATCEQPRVCTRCGQTNGSALGHNWTNATCDSPKTCTRCGKTEGVKLGHNWTAATCDSPKTCTRCGKTEGVKLGHNWTAATCDSPKTCTRCGKTEGAKLGHNWAAATCDSPKTCTRCGKTEGVKLGHNWTNATCDSPNTCTRCGKTEGVKLGHNWTNATCDSPKTCTRCGRTDGYALGHDYIAATCEQPITCTRCGKTSGSALGHDWMAATYSTPETCARCGLTRGDVLAQPASASSGNESDTEMLYIRTDWLWHLGLEMPSTMDELYWCLCAFRDEDPNGNGIPGDEIPLYVAGSRESRLSFAPWGLLDNPDNHIMIDNNGKAVFVPMTDAYRDGLEYWSMLYMEGLINADIYMGDSTQFSIWMACGEIPDNIGAFIEDTGYINGMDPDPMNYDWLGFTGIRMSELGGYSGNMGYSGRNITTDLFTAEELNMYMQWIDAVHYASEMGPKFVIGVCSFDEWNDYTANLNICGARELEELYQSVYDRQGVGAYAYSETSASVEYSMTISIAKNCIVRSGAGLNYGSLGELSGGMSVKSSGTVNATDGTGIWYEIEYQGRKAYINASVVNN